MFYFYWEIFSQFFPLFILFKTKKKAVRIKIACPCPRVCVRCVHALANAHSGIRTQQQSYVRENINLSNYFIDVLRISQ